MIEIEDYNDKCIAIYGDYEKYKSELENLGCLENERLNRKSTGKRCAGMICTKFKRKQIEDLISKLEEQGTSFTSSSSTSSSFSKSGPKVSTAKKDDSMISNLLSRVEKLEATVEALKKLLPNSDALTQTQRVLKATKKPLLKQESASDEESENEESESSDEEEEDVPKRMLAAPKSQPKIAPQTVASGRLLRKST